MDMKKLLLVFAILSLSLVQFSSLVYAQYDPLQNWYEANPNAKWFFEQALGFPDEWMTIKGFVWKFLVPFIGVWAIVLGFLRVIGIFSDQDKLEYVISFVAALFTIPTGVLAWFVYAMFGLMGGWATFLFFGLFFIGTAAYSLVKGRGFWGLGRGVGGVFDTQGKTLTNEIRRMEGKKSRLLREIAEKKGKNLNTKALEAQLDKLESEIRAKEEARRYLARA